MTFTAAAAKANSSSHNNNNKIVIRHPIKIRGHIKNRSITMNVNCKLHLIPHFSIQTDKKQLTNKQNNYIINFYEMKNAALIKILEIEH